MEKKELKHWRKSCGEFVIKFANAQTTDDALIIFFENIKKLFHYSPDFTEKAIRKHPTTSIFYNSFKTEMDAVELLEEIRSLQDQIQAAFPNEIVIVFNETHIKEKAFYLNETNYTQTGEDEYLAHIEAYEFSATEMENYIKSHAKHYAVKCATEDIHDLIGLYERWTSLGNTDFDKINKIRVLHTELCADHSAISKVKEHLIIAFEEILSANNIYKTGKSRHFLSKYLSLGRGLYVSVEGTLHERIPFSENSFIGPDFSVETFDDPIAFCFVEFWKEEQSWQYLKKCSKCKQFFFRKTLKVELSGNHFCSDKCRLAFHNEKNIKSGKHAEYKRQKRKEGAKESYYG